MYKELKKRVFDANIYLKNSGLVILTWGNASEIDRELNIVAIKPSGVPYEKMKEEDIVIVDLDGNIIDGDLNPSVDLPTHLEVYKNHLEVTGIVHTHSTFATSYAQKDSIITLYGTTHADYFKDSIKCVRYLKEDELIEYEKNTGKVICEEYGNSSMLENPGCLVAGHGVFSFGKNAYDAVNNGIVLENIAKMAYLTETLPGKNSKLPEHIANNHYERKHGKNAKYGQNKK